MEVKNWAKLKEKEPKIESFRLNVAQREGFEPSCGFPQTDFEELKIRLFLSLCIPNFRIF